MTDNSPVPASDIYNVDRWGDSYFRIDDQGQLCVRPNDEQGGQATLEAVLESCRAAGLRAPVWRAFPGFCASG
jgi:arginine decarboxylase